NLPLSLARKPSYHDDVGVIAGLQSCFGCFASSMLQGLRCLLDVSVLCVLLSNAGAGFCCPLNIDGLCCLLNAAGLCCLLNISVPVPVEKSAGFNLWFIALIACIPVVLIVVALIICFIYRNRGGTSTLHKNENKADNNPEQELKENDFHDDLNDASRDVETGLNAEARPLSTGIEEADIGKGSEVMEDGSDNIETRPLSCVSEDADCGKGSEFVEDGSDNIETRPLSCGREDADCAKGSEFVEDGLGNIEERPLSFGRGDADFGKKSEVKEEGSLIG
ncbi:hypothetical protein DPMN_071232, partial [Dreissena polymorpha]